MLRFFIPLVGSNNWLVGSYLATIIFHCFFPDFGWFFPDFWLFFGVLLLAFSVLDPDPAVLDPNPAVSKRLPGKIQLASIHLATPETTIRSLVACLLIPLPSVRVRRWFQNARCQKG